MECVTRQAISIKPEKSSSVKNITMETIPPTLDTLLQHCKLVSNQAGIWRTSNIERYHFSGLEAIS